MAKVNPAAVQVPGEEPVIAQEQASTEHNSEQERVGIEQSSEPTESATNEIQSEQVEAAPAIDVEALRAELRAELQAELVAEMKAATKAVGKVASKVKVSHTTGRSGYKDMHAADIDASTLTAPVMTKDGWLCPPSVASKE